MKEPIFQSRLSREKKNSPTYIYMYILRLYASHQIRRQRARENIIKIQNEASSRSRVCNNAIHIYSPRRRLFYIVVYIRILLQHFSLRVHSTNQPFASHAYII